MRGIVALLGAIIGFALVWGAGGAWIAAALPGYGETLHLLIRLFLALLAGGVLASLTRKLMG